MSDPWLVLAGIAMVAVLYVLLPVTGSAFARFSGARQLRCPEAGTGAVVGLDARRAALTAAYRQPEPRVATCSLWPERAGCAQGCLGDLDTEPAPRVAERVS